MHQDSETFSFLTPRLSDAEFTEMRYFVDGNTYMRRIGTYLEARDVTERYKFQIKIWEALGVDVFPSDERKVYYMTFKK